MRQIFSKAGGTIELSNESVERDLIGLWKVQNDLEETASAKGIEAAEGCLGELLAEAQKFIARHRPQQFTLSLGGAAQAGISFTWESKKKPVPHFLTDV